MTKTDMSIKSVYGLVLALTTTFASAQEGSSDVGRMMAGVMAEGTCSAQELSVFATDNVSSVTSRDRQSLARCAWFAEVKHQKAAGMSPVTFEARRVRNPLLVGESVSDAVWLSTWQAYNRELPARYPSVVAATK